jgi:hypothetical protein
MTALALLCRFKPCQAGREWLGDRSPADAWRDCRRGDWLLWVAAKAGVDRRLLVEAACDCAEPALAHVPHGELRPWWAIVVARAWCRGDATIEEIKEARAEAAEAAVADAADAAAYAAAGAAYAAAAADAADADAADAAADAAAYAAADSAAYAANAAARKASLAHSANLVRARIPLETIMVALGTAA